MNADEIEQMNAHGPYDHGVWSASGPAGPPISFGSSSLFATRAEVMTRRIVEYLTTMYTPNELRAARVLDIGCYDGWVLTRISQQIDFARSVGVEPRQKNIDKGVFARRICRLETPCEFLVGGYETLDELFPNDRFDIVLCLGLLHHVSSVETVIKNIARKCSQLLIVDSMVIPPLQHDYEKIAAVINPVDIVYRNKDKLWGMAAYKMESPYFDGSTSDADLVNIPQEALIRMCLNTVRFSKVEALMTERDVYPEEFQALRGVSEVMLAAFRSPEPETAEEPWKKDAREYEALFCLHQPSETFIRFLYVNFYAPELAEHFRSVLSNTVPDETLRSAASLAPEEREIACTVPRGPYEKTLLELAKYQIGNNELASAGDLLRLITTTKNADWRSFYRACFLLQRIESTNGNADRSAHYARLLAVSNPLFPKTDLEKLCAF